MADAGKITALLLKKYYAAAEPAVPVSHEKSPAGFHLGA